MFSISKTVFFENFKFLVHPNVYEPAEDSFLFAENLPSSSSCRVIDVGTGCGILGIIAARRARHVLLVDINPHAIRCAQQNAKLNKIADRVAFVQGDLLGSIDTKARFDLILFNSPYLPSDMNDASWLARSWAGGIAGRDLIDRFINDAPKHLSTTGQILLLQSSLSNVDETLHKCSRKGLEARVLASQSLPFFETLMLVGATWSKVNE